MKTFRRGKHKLLPNPTQQLKERADLSFPLAMDLVTDQAREALERLQGRNANLETHIERKRLKAQIDAALEAKLAFHKKMTLAEIQLAGEWIDGPDPILAEFGHALLAFDWERLAR